jgi:hypothetical protein
LTEFVGYAAVFLVAIRLVWATYAAARRLTRLNDRAAWLAPFALTCVTAIFTVLLTLFAIQEIDRHTWPIVVISQRGTDMSDPIYLGGTYAVEWTAIGGQSECHLAATLRGGDGNAYSNPLFSETIPARTNTGSPTLLLTVDRAAYFVEATADCTSWSIVLTPQH